jgi:hypothetical protein
VPSICSPIASSTIPRATSMKSRFGLERFGMSPSCHGSQQSASPVEIMLTHYPESGWLFWIFQYLTRPSLLIKSGSSIRSGCFLSRSCSSARTFSSQRAWFPAMLLSASVGLMPDNELLGATVTPKRAHFSQNRRLSLGSVPSLLPRPSSRIVAACHPHAAARPPSTPLVQLFKPHGGYASRPRNQLGQCLCT